VCPINQRKEVERSTLRCSIVVVVVVVFVFVQVSSWHLLEADGYDKNQSWPPQNGVGFWVPSQF
jgi:hypothetical protein